MRLRSRRRVSASPRSSMSFSRSMWAYHTSRVRCPAKSIIRLRYERALVSQAYDRLRGAADPRRVVRPHRPGEAHRRPRRCGDAPAAPQAHRQGHAARRGRGRLSQDGRRRWGAPGDPRQPASHLPLLAPPDQLRPRHPEDGGRLPVNPARGSPGAPRSLPARGHRGQGGRSGSVGTRCAVALFTASADDPLFLQVKEARRSVFEPYVGASPYANRGQRVVVGQRLMQAASDLFLGWAIGPQGTHFYVRQLRDMKLKPLTELFTPLTMREYAKTCGWALARAHARSGSPGLIAGYLGKSEAFDEALADFAVAYADQNERDWEALRKAVRDGRIKVQAEA